MKTTNSLLKTPVLLFAAMLVFSIHAVGQLKIGSNPTNINPNAILEMQATNKGLLLPRVALTSTSDPAPLKAFVNGMVVFDTVAVNDIVPGMYYCDGTKWIRLSPGADNSWNTSGNFGTTADTHFLGTTDSVALVMKTNGKEQLRVTETGRVGIGTATPAAALDINGELIIGTLISGDISTDSLLVVDALTGRVKKVSFANIAVKVLKSLDIVMTVGQTEFTTPASYSDESKISLYRNGILISFTATSSTSITAEIPCDVGDEIRIIQLL